MPSPGQSTAIPAGAYVCLKTRSPFGALVRLFTYPSPFDHTVIASGDGMCVQATTRGVKETPLDDFAECLAVVSTDPMSEAQATAVVTHARRFTGDEYAFPAVIVIGLRKFGAKWNWLLRISGDKDALFCSELAVKAGLTASPAMDWLCGEASPALVTPAELAARPGMAPVVWPATARDVRPKWWEWIAGPVLYFTRRWWA